MTVEKANIKYNYKLYCNDFAYIYIHVFSFIYLYQKATYVLLTSKQERH